jgi:hypothetical protein
MAIVGVLPLQSYPEQAFSYGPVSIADAVQSISFRVRRCTSATPTIWPSTAVRLIMANELLVNGQWVTYASGISNGGIIAGRNGTGEAAWTIMGGSLPMAAGRQLRGTLTISGGALFSEAEIEVL